MKITKEIILNYEIEGKNLVFSDLRTLVLAMGTSSVSGNLSFYDIERKDGKYYVSIDTIRERHKRKVARIDKEREYLSIMDQIIKEFESVSKKSKKK
jgi:hypothetical protein